jgi:hypothetical protein
MDEWNKAIEAAIAVLEDGAERLNDRSQPSGIQSAANTAAYYVLMAKIEQVRKLYRQT